MRKRERKRIICDDLRMIDDHETILKQNLSVIRRRKERLEKELESLGGSSSKVYRYAGDNVISEEERIKLLARITPGAKNKPQ